MIGVTKLLCGTRTSGDALRYGRDSSKLPADLLQFSSDKKPIVVWNFTRRCNLRCIHCYSDSQDKNYPGELSTDEGKKVIDDLAQFKVPTILFSGGEPLLRQDIFELGDYAGAKGTRCVISTNGTLIDRTMAKKIAAHGFSYVGISLDGLGRTNDKFRGKRGAFDMALAGIRNCREQGIRVGLRFTLNRHNKDDMVGIFDLMESEELPRFCIYHLAYSGRGNKLAKDDLSHAETREAVDFIFDRALDFHRRGLQKEVLTVDNHADAAYLYLRLLRDQPQRAEDVYQMLLWNGGNNSGVGVACIDNIGDVHADQFWQHYSFGNVRKRKFSEIWLDTSDPVMAGLKEKKKMVKGRCPKCRFLEICSGNLRVRAEAAYGDIWAQDPACYLTDEEIGICHTSRKCTRIQTQR